MVSILDHGAIAPVSLFSWTRFYEAIDFLIKLNVYTYMYIHDYTYMYVCI